MNTYKTTFEVECPNDKDSITYELVIRSRNMIMVEDINEALTAISTIGRYHEDLADRLHAGLGGFQTIKAIHQGIEITTDRGVPCI